MSTRRQAREARVGLPYVNNLWMILTILAINLGMAFLFQFGGTITIGDFVLDASICGVTTSIICVTYIFLIMKKMRRRGALPKTAPESGLMRRLPKQPALLILTLALFFSALMALLSCAVIWFFEIDSVTFPRFLAWKLAYSCVLSAKLIELAILRYMQPDCAEPGDPEQTGMDVVKNPLPRKDTFANLFNTVSQDFGFNMIVGLLSGGTMILATREVVIAPATRSGIVISGLVLGVIVTLRMIRPVAKQVLAVKTAGAMPPYARRSPWLAWLPEKPTLFSLALMPPAMALSAAVLWAVLTFFGFETLNFFQFFVVRTIYVTLLSKAVVALAIARYRQPAKANARQAAEL